MPLPPFFPYAQAPHLCFSSLLLSGTILCFILNYLPYTFYFRYDMILHFFFYRFSTSKCLSLLSRYFVGFSVNGKYPENGMCLRSLVM